MTLEKVKHRFESVETPARRVGLNFHDEGVMIVTQCTRIRSKKEKVFED